MPSFRQAITIIAVALAVISTRGLDAQAPPNPYRVASEAFGQLPDGRQWGSTSAVYASPDGRTIWAADRCGANTCIGKPDMDVIFQFDLDGKLLKSFGRGMFAWPHGMHVDREGNVWVADATGIGGNTDAGGLGHVIYKFDPDGKLLMTLGKKGVAGDGTDTFNQPSDVLVAPSGDIFVVDGHGAGGNNRVLKFTKDGKFIRQWGKTGTADGEFQDPHALAMDSQGRLFVGDRANSRIQIFDQDGNHLATWKQFGRPSGLFIDRNDILYSADSESNDRRNPGVKRGISIGSAKTGQVTAFIPDTADANNGPSAGTSGAEGVAVDATGAIYGAEVGPHTLRKYVKK